MKTKMSKIVKALVALFAFAFAGAAMAETETVGAYTWTYRLTADGKGAELYGDSGARLELHWDGTAFSLK